MNLYPTWLHDALNNGGVGTLTTGRLLATTGMVFLPLYFLHSAGVKPAFLMACIIALGMLIIGFDNGTFYVKTTGA